LSRSWSGIALAARMDGTLRYVDSDSVKAEVLYSLWYAPRAQQVVRLV